MSLSPRRPSRSLLLTLAALQFLQGDHLPKVPYLTLLDRYLLGCYTILGAICVENGFVVSEGADVDEDKLFYVVAFYVWLAFNCACVVFMQCRKYAARSAEKAEMRHNKNQKHAVQQHDRRGSFRRSSSVPRLVRAGSVKEKSPPKVRRQSRAAE